VTEEEEARALRVEAAKLLVLGVQLAAIIVITRRDDLARLGMRVRSALTHQRAREREDTEVAAFGREVSAWEHQEMGR